MIRALQKSNARAPEGRKLGGRRRRRHQCCVAHVTCMCLQVQEHWRAPLSCSASKRKMTSTVRRQVPDGCLQLARLTIARPQRAEQCGRIRSFVVGPRCKTTGDGCKHGPGANNSTNVLTGSSLPRACGMTAMRAARAGRRGSSGVTLPMCDDMPSLCAVCGTDVRVIV